MLVALLLVMVCIGTGYYMVRTYDVSLAWIGIESGRWHIDSFMFFRDMYVLAAAVAAVALVGYFLVASAVRRYKYYLDSGQDYRKMISLADSIDDLTNPAQIARLSGYPELQSVLRNYGDQIREFSGELEQRERENRSVDLEIEIESLLKGEEVQPGVVEGKWWTPLFKKLEKYTQDNRELIGEIESRVERIRTIFCSVVLSNGKVLEAVSGAGEDVVAIVRAVGELNGIDGGPQSPAADGSAEPAGVSGKGPGSAIARMEDSLHRLEQSGRMLDEFSEENNSLALSIALTAAKGGAGDKDLAAFAEKARMTAERFKRFGDDITAIAAEITGGCRVMLRQGGSGGASDAQEHDGVRPGLSEIVKRIERHSMSLNQRITMLKSELEDISGLLQEGLAKLEVSEETHAAAGGEHVGDRVEREEDSDIVNFGADSADYTDDEEDFVIDHGKLWEDDAFSGEPDMVEETLEREAETAPPDEAAAGVQTPFDDGDVRDAVITGNGYMEEPSAAAIPDDAMDDEQGRGIPGEEADSIEVGVGDGWMQDMTDQRNRLTVDNDEPAAGQKVHVEVAEDRQESVADSRGVERTKNDTAAARREAPRVGDSAPRAEDNEPVYDLFELGAVEYVEEKRGR